MKTMKIILALIILIIIIGAAWLSLYGAGKEEGGEEGNGQVVKIGVILPLSGSQAAYGKGIQEGLETALEEINKNNLAGNNRKIELVYEDHAGEVKNAVSAAQKLIEADNVIALISAVSQHSLAIAPIAEEGKVVLYTMASQASALNTAGDYIFKNDDDLTTLGKGAAELVFESGHKKAGIIYAIYNDATVDAANSFKEEFSELGGEVVAMEGIQKDETDFRTHLSKINSNNPTAIFINALTKDSGLILRQVMESNMQQKLFANGAVEDLQVVDAAGNAAEGLVFESFQGVPSQGFIDKIQNKFGHYPLRWTMEAYDGLRILAAAMLKAPEDAQITSRLLKEKLYEIKTYEGTSGAMEFDDLGNARRPLLVKIIRDGKFELYK